MDLDDIIDEIEQASGHASDARDMADSAVSSLQDRLEEINQLSSDWKEYLDEHVTCDEVAEWIISNGTYHTMNLVAEESPLLAAKRLESEQVQAVYWEEVEANRLARALMEAAFLAEAKSQTKWVEPLLDKFEQDKVNAHFAESLKSDLRAGLVRADNADRLNELEDMMKRVQSEIAEMRGDANE
jgi:hypothetical protein